jgi:lipopolysaccharide O-acetyltransferase
MPPAPSGARFARFDPLLPGERIAGGLRRRWRLLESRLRWSWRFAAFGQGSILNRPDLLTAPRGIHIGRGVEIRRGARLEAMCLEDGPPGPRIRIGDGTSIHFYFHCGAAERVEIGCRVLIAGRVYVTDHDHDLGAPGRAPLAADGVYVAPVRIDDDCWLGEGAIVLKGVQLGRGCIVAAGAVVTRSFPPWTLVAGVPARALRRYDERAQAWVRC